MAGQVVYRKPLHLPLDVSGNQKLLLKNKVYLKNIELHLILLGLGLKEVGKTLLLLIIILLYC